MSTGGGRAGAAFCRFKRWRSQQKSAQGLSARDPITREKCCGRRLQTPRLLHASTSAWPCVAAQCMGRSPSESRTAADAPPASSASAAARSSRIAATCSGVTPNASPVSRLTPWEMMYCGTAWGGMGGL
eukprot:359116-Chlamydomonas_euryale.AAC.12